MSGHHVRRLGPDAFTAAEEELGALLADAVAGGDSLGFLAPLSPAEASRWWRSRARPVAEGAHTVWAAYDAAGMAGTVSLVAAPMPNARHRAEVAKLIVHRRARGRGLGRRLLHVAECAAADAGMELLVLDTETDTPADRLYRAAGWTVFGAVPGYAAAADGTLRDCTFFYKRLGPPRPGAAS